MGGARVIFALSELHAKMAAEDKAGHQEFPLAVHDIPPREQIEEASAIAENLLEGHQGVGQGLEDPYTRAVHYLEKHRIVEILQVTMETGTQNTDSST